MFLSNKIKWGVDFMSGENTKKASFATLFSVASVWFGSHAGGGFATGNQATQFYVQYGWYAPIMAVLSMAILAVVLRNVMVMANNHGYTSYKPVFEEMWAPYSKLEILFEIYFYIIVICAVSAAIAGAASLLVDYGIPYGVGVALIGVAVLVLVMFGAGLVARASAVMSVIILICVFIIYILGIAGRSEQLSQVLAAKEYTNFGTALWKVLVYAGFQSVVIPAMIGTGAVLKTKKNASRAVFIGFLMNGIALGLSCVMLLAWYNTGADSYLATNNLTLPTIYICRQLGVSVLEFVYAAALFLCFVSTCVTSVYGLIPRFQGAKVLKNMSEKKSAFIIALLAIVISMGFSLVGLTNVIKYGYSYCGIFGVFIIVIPMLTIGAKKNSAFLKEHPEYIGE